MSKSLTSPLSEAAALEVRRQRGSYLKTSSAEPRVVVYADRGSKKGRKTVKELVGIRVLSDKN